MHRSYQQLISCALSIYITTIYIQILGTQLALTKQKWSAQLCVLYSKNVYKFKIHRHFSEFVHLSEFFLCIFTPAYISHFIYRGIFFITKTKFKKAINVHRKCFALACPSLTVPTDFLGILFFLCDKWETN